MEEAEDHVRQNLSRAFALPESGAFQDLIAAIDLATDGRANRDVNPARNKRRGIRLAGIA